MAIFATPILAHAELGISISTPGSGAASKTQPGTLQLLLEGAALALPEYFLGVAMHEGTHALTAIVLGGTVTDYSLLPKVYGGSVQFGETRWKGDFTRVESAAILLAPKALDLAVMATYTGLLHSSAYPSNKHVQLTLVVLAAGAWVDFSKDLVLTDSWRDTYRAEELLGLTGTAEKVTYRMAYGALSLAGAFQVGQGIYRLFQRESAEEAVETPREPTWVDRLGQITVSPRFVGISGEF